jgi:hypothetical protein
VPDVIKKANEALNAALKDEKATSRRKTINTDPACRAGDAAGDGQGTDDRNRALEAAH